jgi:hypothetical protein
MNTKLRFLFFMFFFSLSFCLLLSFIFTIS